MRKRRFKQIDVFTDQPYLGNALAVVLDGEDLSDAEMQRFARWTNLSETTFLLPPTDAAADYRLRIFTPGGELPFAGHPTLGSCHAWLEAGGQPRTPGRVMQQCGAGLVPIQRQPQARGPERLAFAAPALRTSRPELALVNAVAVAFGLKPQQVLAAQLNENGPAWFSLLLDSPESVLQARPDAAALQKLKVKVGLAGIYADDSSPLTLIGRFNREAAAFLGTASRQKPVPAAPRLEVRGFVVDEDQVYEDPVTGSLNASLAQWLMGAGHLPDSYLAAQGACLGRAGQVHLKRDASGQVWVGGQSVTCVDGSVQLGNETPATLPVPAARATVAAAAPLVASPPKVVTRPFSQVDHLVVFAARLEDGVRWVEALLGVTPGPGGAHALMGTHNRLLNISSYAFPNCYLEIIALDPAATPQRKAGQKRWFDMDNAALQAQVARYGPQLVHFVARCPDVAVAAEALATHQLDCGEIVLATRPTPRGLLQWRMSIRDDGQRLLGGALPALIEWGAGPEPAAHPTDSLPASGLQLQELKLSHPDSEALLEACQCIGLEGVQVQSGQPGLRATFQTPRGLIRLDSPPI